MSCDFVPDECAALSIQAQILAKKCLIDRFRMGPVARRLSKAAGLTVELRATLDSHAQCLLEALAAAYAEVGCPMPPVPALPSAPDLGAQTTQLVDAIRADTDDPVAFLAPHVTITFDEDFRPTRIQTP